jgi:catechol 2,3-dioxygenase-like lactoylglutathione lyase family enzyme
MNNIVISGIQQVGVGVANLHKSWKWYRKYFGIDIRIFEEEAVAKLMLPYTGGQPRKRHAALAVNMQGGGGFEIWQYKDRVPEAPKNKVLLGDYGIFAAKIKSRNVKKNYELYLKSGLNISELYIDPQGNDHFFVQDYEGNFFQIVNGNTWFKAENKLTGAICGVLIGVSDMAKSVKFYNEVLGYDEVVYDSIDKFFDLAGVPGGDSSFRRVLLKHNKSRQGAFSNLLGDSQIELFEVKERKAKGIFADRFWGDLGFIHLCFDISGMDNMRDKCYSLGYPFTVDSSKSFDMGAASGYFSYIEDPDGTLIEFVETQKVAIFKKIGIYLNLRKRKPDKSLPNWMIKTLAFNRVKD